MHILLSSEETLYQVSTRTMLAKGRAEQVSAELFFKLKRSLPKKQFQEQAGYITTAAQAAFASLNKLDWTKEKFCAEVNLTPNTETTISFDRDSSSAGLGYALALALEWRKQLNKTIDYDVEVFATGEIHASGAVTAIGYLETKITAACNFMENCSNENKHPFVIFYPNANQDDVTSDLQSRVAELGGKLCPVERLQSALTTLLGDVYDGDAEGRWEPFKGLLSFNYEDSLRFFGRERALTKLSQEFTEAEGLLVVTGISGSGKSSLVKAGLIPQINQQMLEGNTLDWLISTPKVHNSVESILFDLLETLDKHWSITNLAESDKASALDALSTAALQSPDTFIAAIQQAQKSHPTKQIFWYIDQYEELFNHQAISRAQAQQLAPLLTQLAKQIPHLDIVISIRSEYEDILGKYGSVSHVNPELNTSEWGDIVYKQATSFGLRYEKGLEKRIVDEATNIQHALPALEYLLEQLYKKAKQADENAKTLTHAHYEQLNGIKGVIAARAEEVIAKHPMQAHAFFEYFVGLNNEDKPYAKSVNTDDIKKENEALYSLIESFVDAQLVVDCSTETEKRVKLAHDTLLNFNNEDAAWTALKAWFNENQEYLAWLNGISGDFNRWRTLKNIKYTSFLLNDHDLNLGKTYQQKNVIQQSLILEYIAQSEHYKKKKQKLTIFTALVLFSIVFCVGILFFHQTRLVSEQSNLVNMEKEKVIGLSDEIDSVRQKIIGDFSKLIASLGFYMPDELVPNNMDTIKFVIIDSSLSKNEKQKRLDEISKNIPDSDPFIFNDLSKNGINYNISMVIQYPVLHRLIMETKSIDAKEKQGYINAIPIMKENQIERLFNILDKEKKKELELQKQYPNTYKKLKEANENGKKLIEEVDFTAMDYLRDKNNQKEPVLSIKELIEIAKSLTSMENDESIYVTNKILDLENDEKSQLSIDAYNLLGINYTRLQEYDKAIENYNLEFNLRTKLGLNLSDIEQAKQFAEIGRLYSLLGKYDVTIDYIESSISLAESLVGKKSINIKSLNLYLAYLFSSLTTYNIALDKLDDAKKSALVSFQYADSDYPKHFVTAVNINDEVRISLKSVDFYQLLVDENQYNNDQLLEIISSILGNVSWRYLLINSPSKSLSAAQAALKLSPKKFWIKTNLAHAYLLNGEYKKARVIYSMNSSLKLSEGRSFKDAVLNDFELLKAYGVEHHDFLRIAKEVFNTEI